MSGSCYSNEESSSNRGLSLQALQHCLPLPKVQKAAVSAELGGKGRLGEQWDCRTSLFLVSLGNRDMCLLCVRYSSEQQFTLINSEDDVTTTLSTQMEVSKAVQQQIQPWPSPSSMYLHLQLLKSGTEGA